MNRIVSRLSSKHQITVPKSIRDILGLNEKDLMEFIIRDNHIEVIKGEDLEACPFCQKSHILEQEDCLYCEGRGEIEPLNLETIPKQFYEFFLNKANSIQIKSHEYGFPVFKIEAEDKKLLIYRDVFQVEALKAGIANWSILKIREESVQNELINLFELETSKEAIRKWLSKF